MNEIWNVNLQVVRWNNERFFFGRRVISEVFFGSEEIQFQEFQ